MKGLNWFYRGILILSGIGLFFIFNTACKKSSDTTSTGSTTTPVLTTATVTNINSTFATGGGNISSDGGATVTARGVCWSTTQNPTLVDNRTSDGTGTGSFASSMQGLSPSTPYYVRAYATNSAGTSYGSAVTFTTLSLQPGTVIDIDGNVYHTISIGTQVWLVENLKVTHYRNGDTITHGTRMNQLKPTGSLGEYWNYSNKDSLGNIYGRLYNYYAVVDPRFIAPMGWHVASDSDWSVLAHFLGADSIVGGKLKEAGTTHWFSPNLGATNESGFTALPGGAYNPITGFFSFLGYGASLWTNTPSANSYAYARSLLNNSSYINRGTIPEFSGASVRCLKGD